MRKKNLIVLTSALFLFLVVRSFFGLFTESTIPLLVVYLFSVVYFIMPFVTGKDITVGSTAWVLKKGEDDKWRLIYLIMGCTLALVSLLAPVNGST